MVGKYSWSVMCSLQLVVLHKHMVLRPVAQDPADHLVLAGWDKVFSLRCYDGAIRNFDVSILTLAQSPIQGRCYEYDGDSKFIHIRS